MKELVFISAQPDDPAFSWQIELFIENVRELGYLSPIQVLVFIPADRVAAGPHPEFRRLQQRYYSRGVSFYYYPDTSNLLGYGIAQAQYPPLLRPHILKRHFSRFPELKQKAVLYHDSDILFTRFLDFTPYLNDDICYMSPAAGYLGVKYFDSKADGLLPSSQKQYQELDVLNECATLLGINRAICEQHDHQVGGAQYLLKNIDADFWEDVEIGAYRLRRFLTYELGGVNSRFFDSEQEGIQSWCADMWALLWTLWKKKYETVTPAAFDFCWATDPVSKWDTAAFYHDAGVSEENKHYLFNKRDLSYMYHGRQPYCDSFSHVSADFCSYRYTQHLLNIKEKYRYCPDEKSVY